MTQRLGTDEADDGMLQQLFHVRRLVQPAVERLAAEGQDRSEQQPEQQGREEVADRSR